MADLSDGFIIPDFGDARRMSRTNSADPMAQGDVLMSTPTGGPSEPRKMAFICSKGNLDMAYPALIMGNAALGEGVEVHIFFTFWGLDIINRRTNAKLKFTLAANTAMHMPELGRLHPGWEHKSIPQAMANIPGMTGFATSMMNRQLADLQIPEIPEFLDLLTAAGAHLYACRLTFDMMKIIEADLHPGVEGVISASDFIEISDGAQIVFV